MLEELALKLDGRGNVLPGDDFMTAQPGIFSCGDMRRFQSVVVWAISDGLRAAHSIDKYLTGSSSLPVI